jgi:hypothetical protein
MRICGSIQENPAHNGVHKGESYEEKHCMQDISHNRAITVL